MGLEAQSSNWIYRSGRMDGYKAAIMDLLGRELSE